MPRALDILIAAAALILLAPFVPATPLRFARYYVLTTAAIALGLWDRWRQKKPTGRWEKAAGTR